MLVNNVQVTHVEMKCGEKVRLWKVLECTGVSCNIM